MTGMRVSGSGSTEIVQANQQQAPAAVANAHPDAVSPGSNPPLTVSQSARQAGESSAAGTARLRIAPRHQQKLQEFRAEQATVPGTATPKISPRAALLIGSLLQSEKLPFEVMAARLSPERYQLKQFHGSELQQLLGRFAEPGHAPGKAEVEQLIKGFAQSVADQLEHFQLMHDATADSFGPGGLRDRSTLAVSQAALGEYAGRASKSIEEGLSNSIASLDERIAELDTALENADEGSSLVLLMDRQALEESKATLVDLHAGFAKSPEAKRLNAVAAHAQMDTLVDKLNADRNSVSGWKGAGPIIAAAVPQFLSSMTHLGFVRSATNDEMKDAVPGKSSDASMLKALVVGLVAGVAHEGVTNLVKPMVQAGLQKTGLNERLNMVPLKGIDTHSVIPDPFELKNDNGALVRKTPQEVAEDKAFVEGERAVLNQQKVQVSSTHPLGEMIPYGAFGGGQAVRQMLHDFNQLNGQTVTARALTSGMAGAISATTQTLAQLNSTYVDPRGRKIPVFTPDRAEADLGKDLAKGLDLREPAVRTAFYSKAFSGVQSSALTASLPPVAAQPAATPGRLSAGNILRNMALAATGSVSYLSTLYANQSVTAEAKALKEAGMGGATPMLARTETALNNIRHPDRASLPHTFQPGTLGGVPRALESAYHMGRGALQLPTQVVVDTVRVAEDGVSNGVSSLRNALRSEKTPETPSPAGNAAPDDAELVALEEGRRR
ncbi:restriction endonuclease [Pseudomonas syringae]|uniref:Restriction endonuclease n=2 Tax=Pseudomonas syringae TaxID=317 RepID=A0A9Q4FHJ2_PSESX|nr:restriction endonuclease [Pseudomonas syringae]MCF5630038.1 restriction endonuclease [Pseudomonas syringae]